MNDKLALRARLRATRDGFVPAGAIRVPDAFAARLTPGLIVAAYIPIGSEADPAPFVTVARAARCRIALPHVTTRAAPIRFLAWDDETPLEHGPFGLRQPAADAPELAPAVILTPLLGFDAAGNRLGQGAGHYDRAFAAHPHAWRIGIAWSVQRVDRLIPDSWDVPLHAIATESDWIIA
ncbi:5-formyltetrahydrofolate cyclo-ligase [Sphingomonas sp. RP10(2022)]|uniref:5-formyltetrahydrofolate cyclo-ligase n=1 Tax=Sphingomonas liriopis TaxID=2949094 RepID=A0A9X2KN85_9SPHN|nr:5-formyltetrahydrofolate cyclo-ligase [Sphingomonas liriopis]MCP3733389.1 5-formyltetrahydrofolate cyclo-ligase [Sphingomonas liriopis]